MGAANRQNDSRARTERRSSSARDGLSATTERVTISDVVSCRRVEQRLPPDWHAHPEVVQEGRHSLNEVIAIEQRRTSAKLRVRPERTHQPTDCLHVEVRWGATKDRHHVLTASSLSDAFNAVLRYCRVVDTRGDPGPLAGGVGVGRQAMFADGD